MDSQRKVPNAPKKLRQTVSRLTENEKENMNNYYAWEVNTNSNEFRPLNIENGHIGPALRVQTMDIFKILRAAANETLKTGTQRVPVFNVRWSNIEKIPLGNEKVKNNLTWASYEKRKKMPLRNASSVATKRRQGGKRRGRLGTRRGRRSN